MVTTPSMPWPRLSRNEAQARTLVAQRALACPVELAGQPWLLDVQPWPPGAASPPGEHWRLHLSWGGAFFDLWLPASSVQGWMAAVEPELDLPALPDAFAAAVLEEALAAALAALTGLQRGAARLEALARGEGGAVEGAHLFGLRLMQGEGEKCSVVHGVLAADTLGLMLMAGLLAQRPAQPNELQEDAIPVPLRIALGTARLSAQELDSLHPGDAVLLEQSWLEAGESGRDCLLWLLAGNVGARVAWNEGRLTVTHAPTSIGFAMSETPPAPEADAGKTPDTVPVPGWQGLPVRLEFDLGERVLTLGEVKALQVGQVLELPNPPGETVRIRANGVLIGSGELVEIDGRLGVVIASLSMVAKAGQ